MSPPLVATEPQGTNRRSRRAAKKAKSEREERRQLASEMSQSCARRACLLATQRENQRKLQLCKKEAEREDEELRVMEAEHAALLRLVNRSCA